MTAPRLVLPESSMPWGRWLQEENEKSRAALGIQAQDFSSVGAQFASRADALSGQISAVSNVSTQYTQTFLPYTRSKPAGSLSDPNVMLESPPMSFSPPKPTGTYRVLLFANMNASQIAGTGNLDFTWTYLSVSSRIYRQPAVEENRPGATGNSLEKIASVSAWDIVSDGNPTTVQIGLLVGADAKTIDFTASSVTAIYVGGL